jgi:hypothetical protein
MGGRTATAVVQQAIPPFRGDRTAPSGRWARGEDVWRLLLSSKLSPHFGGIERRLLGEGGGRTATEVVQHLWALAFPPRQGRGL